MPNTPDTIEREVKGKLRTFSRNQRYLVNDETGDIEIYHPAIARKSGWSEYLPVQNEIVSKIKDATPVRLAELDAARSELKTALTDLAELQEQFDAIVDSKLALERQNFDLLAKIAELEARPEPEDVLSESVAASDEEDAPIEADDGEEAAEDATMDGWRDRIISELAVGRTTEARARSLANKVVHRFPTPEALMNATGEELEEIPGIGPTTAAKLLAVVSEGTI